MPLFYRLIPLFLRMISEKYVSLFLTVLENIQMTGNKNPIRKSQERLGCQHALQTNRDAHALVFLLLETEN